MPQVGSRIKAKRLSGTGRHRWTSDDIVKAVVELEQRRSTKAGRLPGAGNAVRRILGLPQRPGVVAGERVDPEEIFQLKALLLDNFFQVYGGELATGLMLRRAQKGGGQKGVQSRRAKADLLNTEIERLAKKFLGDGKPERSIASMVSLKVGVTPRHVRNVLKKAEVT